MVLVVDLDPQGNASTGLGIRHEARDVTVYDVLAAEAPIDGAIVPTPVENLHAIPSTIDLAGAEIELVSQFSRELRLRKALEPLKEDSYDFIFLDCPPSLGLLTVNALAAAEELIVPIQCEYYALEGLGQLLRNVRLVQQNVNPRSAPHGNRHDDVRPEDQALRAGGRGGAQVLRGARLPDRSSRGRSACPRRPGSASRSPCTTRGPAARNATATSRKRWPPEDPSTARCRSWTRSRPWSCLRLVSRTSPAHRGHSSDRENEVEDEVEVPLAPPVEPEELPPVVEGEPEGDVEVPASSPSVEDRAEDLSEPEPPVQDAVEVEESVTAPSPQVEPEAPEPAVSIAEPSTSPEASANQRSRPCRGATAPPRSGCANWRLRRRLRPRWRRRPSRPHRRLEAPRTLEVWPSPGESS